MNTPLKTVKHWLLVIARSRTGESYSGGVHLFMKQWHQKTPSEVIQLCRQLKEVANNNEPLAIALFGRGATRFLKQLEVQQINWPPGMKKKSNSINKTLFKQTLKRNT